MEPTYNFKFTFYSETEGRTVEHRRTCTFEQARMHWQDLIDIARVSHSSAHKAWYQGSFGQRWHRWK